MPKPRPSVEGRAGNPVVSEDSSLVSFADARLFHSQQVPDVFKRHRDSREASTLVDWNLADQEAPFHALADPENHVSLAIFLWVVERRLELGTHRHRCAASVLEHLDNNQSRPHLLAKQELLRGAKTFDFS